MTETIADYITSSTAKVAIKDVTEHFKGKAVSRLGDEGNVAVINLSDMTSMGIDYAALKRIKMDKRAVLRYLLQDGDVLIASKGTVKKIAVFSEQNQPVIASANITVLRPTGGVLGGYIKLFLESPLGQALLDEANTGKAVMNVSTQKLISIEIPKIPLVKQTYLVQRYEQGLNDYKRKIVRAQQEWQRVRDDVEKNLF
ncbi:restriction endonuclease subunit S [uncultured Streptococcus sp.]|uniref:restriction endonuclease subunit S n=1 Tax=uncultured Streptococcus sp. TaxID=83427 RepID=UPI0026221AA4|nr:restriction endonuclease subunit S [uncultured Streptococcus sp.]